MIGVHIVTRAIATLLALQLAGCSGEEDPRTTGTPVTFDTVCDKSNEGKRVALEGYLHFPKEFRSKDITVLLRLRPAKGDSVVAASVELGNGPNQLAMPPLKYSPKDLKVTTNDGKTLGYTDRAKVSGKMYYPIVTQEFKCGLTGTLIEMP